MFVEIPPHGLLDNVFGHEGRGVIDTLALALLAFFLHVRCGDQQAGLTLRFGNDVPEILLVGCTKHVCLQGVEVVAHEILLVQSPDERLQRHTVAVQFF